MAYPSESDFLYLRCRKLAERLGEGHPLKDLAVTLWESFKEETHKLAVPVAGGERLDIGMLSVQQSPTRRLTFYEWQHVPDTIRKVQRARAAHASLRCALAGTDYDKVIGVVNVNLQELTLSQVDLLCGEMARWWERGEGTYLSPFSQMAYVMRNWLDGVYGDKPSPEHPSLLPLREVEVDPRMLAAECAKSVYSILREQLGLGESPEVGVVGVGAWAESASSELRCLGAICDQFDHISTGRERKILFLMHTENCITADVVDKLKCGALVEILPGQINPEVDGLLRERGIVVVPDLLCTCAQEIIEDWWLGGRRVPGWAMALYLKLSEVWRELQARLPELECRHHDAALMLALERLAARWEI